MKRFQPRIDLECKDNVLIIIMNEKLCFRLNMLNQAHKGIATYANDGAISQTRLINNI